MPFQNNQYKPQEEEKTEDKIFIFPQETNDEYKFKVHAIGTLELHKVSNSLIVYVCNSIYK